ncbi:IS5 family transposase [Amycolatopsis rhabdoformis]|uniref:IS5 family transposase n=1 Tax=Amycolatopsis rhabdoformis TaxID=1448059 RepID=A0ABZ1IKU9_9PSEU|nr:IS5 family transposase [Amycolatopsis rhabdoformis]WSE34120.1 IS5 family transposase [Amycolatopsis rhabdoformis]
MVGRGELTDRAWAVIEPLLPPVSGGGRRWRDHRQVINAILWKLRTGAPWRDQPERYGLWETAHERLRLWTKNGTWDKILDHVIVKDDAVGDPEWVVSVDSSVVRAHRHSAGARKKRGCSDEVEAIVVDGEELGRSRGGLSTKIHLAVDGRGLPMRFLLTAGQAGDIPQLVPLLNGISIARLRAGRPRSRPDAVIADKAYSLPSTREAMRRRINFVSPRRHDQIARRTAKGSRGGRPPTFDPEAYKQRNVVKRCFNRLKQFRDLATRYAKRAACYQAELTIAAIVLWLR